MLSAVEDMIQSEGRKMLFIQEECDEIKEKAPRIEGLQMITCVPAMVKCTITKTKHKHLSAAFQFPDKYPDEPILVELRSKVLSYKLLEGLSKVCEDEAKKHLGQRQVLLMMKLIRKFIEDNPLCVCSDEISYVKRELLKESDEIKLKQKTSQVVTKLKEGEYFINVRLLIPDTYPDTQVQIDLSENNFPQVLKTNFIAQSVEMARKAVQPPLKKNPKDPPFEPKPSLQPVLEYLVKHVIRKFPNEKCPCCGKPSLPPDPKNVTELQTDAMYVERMYCGHLFHHGCLDEYMKKPPFTGGKKCPSCGKRIFHEKWKLAPELAEARWAHKEARRRELAEVVDFLE